MLVDITHDEMQVIITYLIDQPWVKVESVMQKMKHMAIAFEKKHDPEAAQRAAELRKANESKATGKRINGSPRADAPYGLKKDGTPKKRPGRAPKA